MQTRITKLLEIEYPVIQGGMAWVANAALAANVSKAGGIGFIGAANAPAEWVRSEIRRAKEITDKPIGVNVMLLSEHVDEVALFQIVQRPLHCARREVQVAGNRLDTRPAAPAACTVTEVHIDCPRPVRQVGIGVDFTEEAHLSP